MADHMSSFILEDMIYGGPVGRVFPLWQRGLYETEKAITKYKVIQNFGAETSIVPVVAVIKALKEGSTTCDLTIGSESTKLNVTIVPLEVVS